MTANEMAALCLETMATPYAANGVSIVIPKGFKRPPGFPRGELLCENPNSGDRVYSMNPVKLLAWLSKNELVKITIAQRPTPAAAAKEQGK
jgi:hypothetical protein